MSSAAQCVRCGRELADTAYVCPACADRAHDHLGQIIDMTPAARDVAHGLSRRTSGSGGSGKPGSRLPLDLTATAKLDAVQGELTTWARHVAEERSGRPLRHAGDDPIVHSARYLAANLEWLRHRPEADEAFTIIAACARVLRGIAHGPVEQRYLGPCGAPTWCDVTGFGQAPGSEVIEGAPCEGDIYGRTGAELGRCRTCGAEVEQEARRAWLDSEVRQRAFRAAQIAEAYGVNVKTIRTWATRPRPDTGIPPLASYWRTEAGLITPWTDPPLDANLKGDDLTARLGEIADEIQARGGRLHYVGDVLDLAAADAARRETERAKRERRAAAREPAEMGA